MPWQPAISSREALVWRARPRHLLRARLSRPPPPLTISVSLGRHQARGSCARGFGDTPGAALGKARSAKAAPCCPAAATKQWVSRVPRAELSRVPRE